MTFKLFLTAAALLLAPTIALAQSPSPSQGIDITCDPATRGTASAAERLICDHALLSMGYRRIFADQQRLLREKKIDGDDVAAFRRQRDACTTLDCLDGVFSAWKQKTADLKSGRNGARP
ncbi:hypothetical protein [Cupriavidus plantarum]|uniref:hypothetical protein n=1 Tax=Cupriavidus plantarum TaxID=942865 RepID=UPI0015CBF94A|nr:hypothetical protein [Cupriavidus plantarum]NYI01719.1 hypothetical protein [Cupriavidus plantarum]